MSDVFLSYKREDEARVARLADALERAGLSVWWDKTLPGGESWRANIGAALDRAKCVIVVWTRESAGPAGDFVRDEASQAKARGILVPTMIERTRIPLGFGELQTIDLSHWRGNLRDPFFTDLVEACRAKIEGRPAPRARGPASRLVRRFLTFGTAATVAAMAGFAFSTDLLQMQNRVCVLPVGQPALSDLCGALSLGDRPTREERLAWASIPAGDCQALRTHIERFPAGVHRAAAADLISARRVSIEHEWTPTERPLAIYVGRDAEASQTEASAREAAIARANDQAERRCRDFAASGLFRFEAASAAPQEWICERVGSGFVCGLDGRAVCRLSERRDVERERCGAPQ